MSDIDADIFEYIKPLTWQEVFELWRDNEEKLEHWQKLMKEKKMSWEQWRMKHFEILGCKDKEWSLYKIKKSLQNIPKFHGGPFTSWKEHFYGERDFPTFEILAKDTEAKNYKPIIEITNNFPKRSTLIGYKTEIGIVILEGMHRCVAAALISLEKKQLDSEIFIALATTSQKNLQHYIFV